MMRRSAPSRPEGDAAVPRPAEAGRALLERLLDPDRLAGCRIPRLDQADRVRRVDDAVDHQRRRAVGVVVAEVRDDVEDRLVDRRTGPRRSATDRRCRRRSDRAASTSSRRCRRHRPATGRPPPPAGQCAVVTAQDRTRTSAQARAPTGTLRSRIIVSSNRRAVRCEL